MAFRIFDFRKDIRNVIIEPEIRARFMRLDPGDVGPAHTHDLGQEIFLVLQGQAEFEIEGHKEILGPGQMCFAAVDESHTVTCVGDEPMIMYLSVTPHIEPTHTWWDSGGNKLPPRYGTTLEDVDLSDGTIDEKLDASVASAEALARSAVESASIHSVVATRVKKALAADDRDAAKAAVDEMWNAMYPMFRNLRKFELAWNAVTPLVAED